MKSHDALRSVIAELLNPLRATALVCALAAALPQPLSAQANPAVAQVSFDIPAGPLDTVLNRFGRQIGVLLSVDSALTQGRVSPGVRGERSIDSALEQILAGTGLEAVRAEDGSYSLRKLPPRPVDATRMPLVKVAADPQEQSAWGPVDGYVAKRSATATKTNTALLDTPQTLTVILREQMELQAAPSVTRALEYAPGIIPAFGGTNTQSDVVQVRGFYPRDFLDGLRLPFSAYSVAVPQFDPYLLERVELLQGPASGLFGQSSPGGVINMVSRRPQDQAAYELALQAGNYDRKQLAFDATGPLNDARTLLYRLTGLARDNDGYVDFSREERQLIAPAFTWQPTDATSFTLLTHYQHDDLVPQYQSLPAAGTLLPNPNGTLPRERFPGEPDWDRIDREQYGVGYAFQTQLGDDWQFRQNARYTNVAVDSRALPGIALLADSRTSMRVATASRAEGSLAALDNQLETHFETGALAHTLLMGLDVMRQRDDYRFASQLASNLDLYEPSYGATMPTLIPRLSTLQEMTQVGVYAQDQVRLERWLLTLGARHDWAAADTRDRMAGATVSRTDEAFSGRVGINYRFDNGIAPYASASTSFEPVLGTDFSGAPFDPSKGRQAEIGVRYQPEGGGTLLSLAAYRLTQRNVLTPDTAVGHAGFSVQTGEVQVDGVSAEARTQPLPNLDLIANYAYTDSEVTRANPTAAGASLLGKPLARTPLHTASLWLAYNLTGGVLSGLTTGLGVRYLGDNYTDTGITMRLPSQTLLDMAAHYQFGSDWKLSLSIANLADDEYVSYCLGATQCFWGQPRTAQLSLRKHW